MIAILALIWAAVGAPGGEFEFALPVGSNGETSRPFLIQAWPDGGCPDCVVNEDDKAALKVIINDLKAPVGTASTYPKIEFHYVNARPLTDSVTSIDDIREKIEACSFGTAAILSPYPTSNVTAFGLRFDCNSTKTLMWMSVVMGNDHRPRLAYLVPNYPFPLKRAH